MRAEKLHKGKQAMTTQFSESNQLLSRAQVAEIFGVSRMTVIRLERDGSLPAVRLGAGTVRYKHTDVRAFIEQSMQVTA